MRLSELRFLQKYLFFFVHIKGLLTHGFAKRYYSQGGEDIVLEHLFAHKSTGFYVDVGAYHPKHYSNTYLLYKKGWRGINIDPNPNSIRLFNWHRRRDKNLNYGISKDDITKPYFIFNHQSCNTFSEKQKELMLKKKFIRLVGKVNIPCVPLRNILNDHAPSAKIDLLNIDVEGMNEEVLRSFDWDKTHPSVICVEDDHLDLSGNDVRKSRIHAFLAERSYVLHAKLRLSSIYIRKEGLP